MGVLDVGVLGLGVGLWLLGVFRCWCWVMCVLDVCVLVLGCCGACFLALGVDVECWCRVLVSSASGVGGVGVLDCFGCWVFGVGCPGDGRIGAGCLLVSGCFGAG